VTFDTSRLRPGEIVAAVGAILLFVFMFFFKWYGVGLPRQQLEAAEAFGLETSWTGWEGHTVLRWLMLLTIIAALALAFLTATQRTVALPVTMAVIVTALAALLTVLLAYRVIVNEPHGPNELIDVEIGAWLGLLSSALITYGGYLSMRDEGTSLSDAKQQARAAGQQARAAFEGGAPRSGDGEASSAPPPPSAPPESPSPPPPAAPPPPPAPEAPAAPPMSEPPPSNS
jgi:hypothetical protein